MELEIIITDNLIKFHADNLVGISLIVWLGASSLHYILNAVNWYLERKLKGDK